jgi:lipopolysaccharide transport system permease protein
VNSSPMIFLSNASIIKKVNFPRNLLPFTQVLQDMIHFLLAIPVIVLFIFIYRKSPFLSWSYGIPTLLMLQFMLTYGICLIAASINLFFRDLERLIIIFTTLLFYFTPVVYSETMIPERFKIYLVFNPLALLMVSWRNIFLYGSLNPAYLALIFVYSITALGAGYFIYRKLSWKFAEVL